MYNDALIRAIRMIGSQQKLARELGVARSTINHWLNRGTGMSLENALLIETLTHGVVTAELLAPSAAAEITNFKKYILKSRAQ